MSKKEVLFINKQSNVKRMVCIIANQLIKQGLSRSVAFAQAWVRVKASVIMTKVNGVSFGRRQEALQRLTGYSKDQIKVHLAIDANDNAHAVAVIVEVIGKGSYKVGYLPKTLSTLISLVMNKNIPLQSHFEEVHGGHSHRPHYGIDIKLSLAG